MPWSPALIVAGIDPPSPAAETLWLDLNTRQLKAYNGSRWVSAAIGDRLTGTAAAGAVTLNASAGRITSEALTTAAGADYTLTMTNSRITATSIVLAAPGNGTNTIAGLSVQRITPAAGSVVILVRNTHASSALDGTIRIDFVVFDA